MSNVLFGLNIAQIVNQAIADAGGVLDGTLVKRANTGRTPGNLTGGQNPSETSHAFKGFIENRSETRRNGSLVSQEGQFVTILGDSLPSDVTPAQGDEITIEGRTFEVLGVPVRDPAAAAYECEVQ
jgi:hypothetical protein